ncbi:hypothetical protein ABZ847_29415 [Streptomyces bauhiniae]
MPRTLRRLARLITRRRPPAPLDDTGPATRYATRTGSWAVGPADRQEIW